VDKLLYDNLTTAQRQFFLKYLYNGVGSGSFPIKPPRFVFSNAAKYHDFASWSGGTEKDRIEASREFFHKAHDTIRQQPWRKQPFYYFISYVYYRILKKVDGMSWSYFTAPAKDWTEFIDHVRQYYIQEGKDIPEYLNGAEAIS